MENKSMKQMANEQIFSYMEWRDMELQRNGVNIFHITHAGGRRFNAMHLYFRPTDDGVQMEAVMPVNVMDLQRMNDLRTCIRTVNEWQKAWNSGFEFCLSDEDVYVLPRCTLPAEETSPQSLLRFRCKVTETARLMEHFTDVVMKLMYNPTATVSGVICALEDALCSKEA